MFGGFSASRTVITQKKKKGKKRKPFQRERNEEMQGFW